jgi:purine-binding chemotaxis protein CheW
MKKDVRNILKNRAKAMAVAPETEKSASEKTEIIEFVLGAESYGIESAYVREVYQLKDFTSLPGVPGFIYGIINIRGQILPVVDLKKFMNLSEKGLGELNKVIILSGGQMEFGILADTVEGTRTLLIDDILPVPPTIVGIGEKYLKGVTKENIIVLEAEAIIYDEKIIVSEEVV